MSSAAILFKILLNGDNLSLILYLPVVDKSYLLFEKNKLENHLLT